VRLDAGTGGIASIFSKTHGRELVRKSEGAANRWAYKFDGVDGGATRASLEGATGGPVFGEIGAVSSDGRLRVATTVRLYADLDRIDIDNRVEKIARAERESLHFFFPFDVERGTFRFEAPGAVIAAGETGHGGEQLPGSGQAYTAVRHFADVSNDAFGVTLSQCDSGIVQFGDRTESADPVAPPEGSATLVAFALDNTVNYPEVTRDQGGATAFTFRFSIRAHGPFDAAEAVRFAWEDNNELLAAMAGPEEGGQRPTAPAGSSRAASEPGFVEAAGEGIVLANVKPAEESPEGSVVVRLWNTGPRAAAARVSADERWTVKAACAADLLERRGTALAVVQNAIKMNVPARGFATVLLDFEKQRRD
jgi:alpha-mannosidase